MQVKRFEKEDISKVIAFEKALRIQEPETYFWSIDDDYERALTLCFDDQRFKEAVTFLAVEGDDVIGRIDASPIISRFDGQISSAYLDWICVLKDHRHRGVARVLMNKLKNDLKEKGISSLIILTSTNEEAKRFYDSLEHVFNNNAAIWVDITQMR